MVRTLFCSLVLVVSACSPDKPAVPIGDASRFVVKDGGHLDGRSLPDGEKDDASGVDSGDSALPTEDTSAPDGPNLDSSSDSGPNDAPVPDGPAEDGSDPPDSAPPDTTPHEGGQHRGRG